MTASDQAPERLSLADATSHILDECRMVLPGIQALFGFQMIAVFNDAFNERLSAATQRLHLGAILLVVLAIGLVMTPAALHRRTQPFSVSRRFIVLATRLLLYSMGPLALALSLDVYVVVRMLGVRPALGASLAAAALVWLLGLWYGLPGLQRGTGRRRQEGGEPARPYSSTPRQEAS